MSNDKFNQIIFPMKDKLYRLSLSILREHREAEDVVQDTLLKLWSKKDEWSDIENLEAYCYRAVKNLSLDRISSLTAKKTETIEQDKENFYFIDMDNPYLEFIRNEQNSVLYKGIEELSENQKLVFQLREIEGMSYKKIAVSLDITEDLVKISLFRARKKIKELLEKYNNNGL